MRVRPKDSRGLAAGSFARAAVLLCLIAHASLATITHHHGGSQNVSKATSCSFEAGPSSDSNRPLRKGADECVSCGLQRNFVSDVRPVSIPPDVSAEPITREFFISHPTCNGISLVLSDRAPPLG